MTTQTVLAWVVVVAFVLYAAYETYQSWRRQSGCLAFVVAVVVLMSLLVWAIDTLIR